MKSRNFVNRGSDVVFQVGKKSQFYIYIMCVCATLIVVPGGGDSSSYYFICLWVFSPFSLSPSLHFPLFCHRCFFCLDLESVPDIFRSVLFRSFMPLYGSYFLPFFHSMQTCFFFSINFSLHIFLVVFLGRGIWRFPG